jgi:hypothetical protein
MEKLIRFLDKAEDAIVAAMFSVRRSLSRKPKERRKIPRRQEEPGSSADRDKRREP